MQVLTVQQITAYLNAVFESDPVLADIWLEGEVSGWSQSQAGHCYWTLREGEAQLRAVCFRRDVARQPQMPHNGDLVLAHGAIRLYNSRIDLIVDAVRPAGIGLLQAQLDALRVRLEGEGLFARKRPLPEFPRRIGVVTSPTGAALRDILTVIARRWPLCEVLLSPSAVQGEDAPGQLVEALYNLYELELDLIIVARGGGSVEDLWAFNDEAVVRAVYASPVPTITGVGHETDTTLVDYVADLRAATPSVAAEKATPDIEILRDAVAELGDRLLDAMAGRIALAGQTLHEQLRHVARRSPDLRLANDRQTVDQLQARLERAVRRQLDGKRALFAIARAQLAALSPRSTLGRGYAIVRRPHGPVVTSSHAVDPGDALLIDLHDGALNATVDDEG
ncbi:MAG: exodeoxyribonuclease VII large subunit [Herpetosiphonaceae bacterium]|nr:exodeoxyribonuclease VII large subunit [Herpetosiphonaceae bacterium]